MGKQSKRKKAGKKSRKERPQARRENVREDEQQQPQVQQDEASQQRTQDPGEPIEEGDRVLYRPHEDTDTDSWSRGILKRKEGPVYFVLDLLSEDRDDVVKFKAMRTVVRDPFGWNVRFEPNDKVIVRSDGRWKPATVSSAGPRDVVCRPQGNKKLLSIYSCLLDEETSIRVNIREDNDDHIIRHPSSFRLAVGDQVIFSSTRAKGYTRKGPHREPWIRGVVERVHVVGLKDYYAVYECSFTEQNKTIRCHILKDDDEHVARAKASPRERLMDSIEQGCSYLHIDCLVKSSGMDVTGFRGLLLTKAIEYGSYSTLVWLQENAAVDLRRIRDAGGNGLLHQVAKSSHAERFFREASVAEQDVQNEAPCIDLSVTVAKDGIIEQRNNQGRSWLHVLITSGNSHALELVLSPKEGVAWAIVEWLRCPKLWPNDHIKDKNGVGLRETARVLGRYKIENMVSEFFNFLLFHGYTKSAEILCSHHRPLGRHNKEISQKRFASFLAKGIIRFYNDWGGPKMRSKGLNPAESIATFVGMLASAGFISMLRLIIGEDSTLLTSPAQRLENTSVNRNEFAQPELYEVESPAMQSTDFSLVELAAHGGDSPYLNSKFGNQCRHSYGVLLLNFAKEVICGEDAAYRLVSYLQSQIDERSAVLDKEFIEFLKLKVSLLLDDESLSDRLKVLNYLVRVKSLPPPNAVDAIRWRQCGILRWLVEESFVDLHADVGGYPALNEKGKNMTFLNCSEIPTSMTVGVFLCLAAIEFDDLQSLQWLLDNKNVQKDQAWANGWNMIHHVAYHGRSEIFLWLWSRKMVPPYSVERSDCEHVGIIYALRIALERGFTLLADLFLESGCPTIDSKGNWVYAVAIESKLEFVRDRGDGKMRPLSLRTDVEMLLDLLSTDGPLPANGCLDFERWRSCGVATMSEPGPTGKSYLEVVDQCCAVSDRYHADWLFDELLKRKHSVYTQDYLERGLVSSSNDVEQAHRLGASALKNFALEKKDGLLVHYLSEPWCTEISCIDPCLENVVLGRLLNNFRSDPLISSVLQEHRDTLLRIRILHSVHVLAMKNVAYLFTQGVSTGMITKMIELAVQIANNLAALEGRELEAYFKDSDIVSSSGKVNLNFVLPCDHNQEHPLHSMVEWWRQSCCDVSRLYVTLAIRGHRELVAWSRAQDKSAWDAKKETAVVRIAAYLGHVDLVQDFLQGRGGDDEFFWSKTCWRLHAAVLGAAEAGNLTDMALYVYCSNGRKLYLPQDPMKDDFERINDEQVVASSWVGTAVFAYLNFRCGPEEPQNVISQGHKEVLTWMVSNSATSVGLIIRSATLVMPQMVYVHSLERCSELLMYVINDLNGDVMGYQRHLDHVGQKFVDFFDRSLRSKSCDMTRLQNVVVQWLKFISDRGIDIQSLAYRPSFDKEYHEKQEGFVNALTSMQAEQRQRWSGLDHMKTGRSLKDVKHVIEKDESCLAARYVNGMLLTHLAAAYNRVDVLQWLVEEKGLNLDAYDTYGRTVAEVAEASGATTVIPWISRQKACELISDFVTSHFRRRRARKHILGLLCSIRTIQAWQRGNKIRLVYRARLLSRLEGRRQFHLTWDRCISMLSVVSATNDSCNWAALKQQEHDIMRSEDVEDQNKLSETSNKLTEAAQRVLSETNPSDECQESDTESEAEDVDSQLMVRAKEELDDAPQTRCHNGNMVQIMFTKDVVKWVRTSDSKYREFFARRVEQLASGERTRILAKRLTGCKTTIYETYLEQKSGHRILWTEKGDSLLIWYVSKHKDVSRLIGLIDDAESRSSRQLTSSTILSDSKEESCPAREEAEQIMLDPLSDTPLKVYEILSDDVATLNDPTWRPQLHLTASERKIVETKGTVLLLGRSGTGKTSVICSRIDYDRRRARGDEGCFSQLFVARSKGLCDYVKNTTELASSAAGGDASSMSFLTFNQLIRTVEGQLLANQNEKNLFCPTRRMDFGRFKQEVYRPDSGCGLDALVVWTNIRSFIKGSIEAFQAGNRVLSEDDYLRLGKRRCRLSPDQRKSVYSSFKHYDKCMKELGMWDDCDRITAFCRRLEYTRVSDPDAFEEIRYSKLYVDEIQDYTQAEIAAFFYLGGARDLFMAGDPAQSVVEGVEFRFEEIRSVAYQLYGDDRRKLIPEKPLTVHTNFRSHCGVLNVAAAVLSCLFSAFPDSAKQLKGDRGLFQGPRPGVFHKVAPTRLEELVRKRNGIVVLAHDRDVSKWKLSLGYPLVYGIREAKGLEFQEVILIDFFSSMPEPLQKPWRDLLLGRKLHEVGRHPEVEGHLKLLYTAITRCIQRLFFAETVSSISGEAFVRWLTTTTLARNSDSNGAGKEALAVKNNVDDVDKMTRTPDEWRSSGLDNAVMAESSEDLLNVVSWLEKAVYCFEQVGDTVLASRAGTHRSSVRFRLSLMEHNTALGSGESNLDPEHVEAEAARLVEKLIFERLLFEAREVCYTILPLQGEMARDMLKTSLISRLLADDDSSLSGR